MGEGAHPTHSPTFAARLTRAATAAARSIRRTHRPGFPYFAGAPLLIAHRGGSALAPENTLLAFSRALEWWHADLLELDVHATRDGEVVVFHDDTLDRTTNGSGVIAARSLEELKQLDAGYRFTPDGGKTFPFRATGVRIPTLAEVLRAFPGIRVNIEIKDGRAQERVWDTIREAAAGDRVLIAAGDARNRERLAGYPVPVSAGKQELRWFVGQLKAGAVLFPPDVDALQIPFSWDGKPVATPRLVAAAHRNNLAVHVWTVDDEGQMEMLLDWGVDGIITDRPDRLAKVLNRRVGRPIPPGPPHPPPEPFLEYLLRP